MKKTLTMGYSIVSLVILETAALLGPLLFFTRNYVILPNTAFIAMILPALWWIGMIGLVVWACIYWKKCRRFAVLALLSALFSFAVAWSLPAV